MNFFFFFMKNQPFELKVRGRNLIRSDVRNNTQDIYLPAFKLRDSNISHSGPTVSRYRNRPVIETHYSPNVKLVSLSFRCVKPRDRDDIAPKYLLIADLSLPPFLFLVEKRSNVSTKGSCTVTSDPYRAINASSTTIKRARASNGETSPFIRILQINN